jgi:hypothetical protein
MSSPNKCPSPFLDPNFYKKPEETVQEYLKKNTEINKNLKNIEKSSKKDGKDKKEDTPKKKDSDVVDQNKNQTDVEEEARTQKVIQTCLDLLEKKYKEDEQDENKNKDDIEAVQNIAKNLEIEKKDDHLKLENNTPAPNEDHQPNLDNHQPNLDLPAPPNGIYSSIDNLQNSIQEFAQAHGYAIVRRRTVGTKSITFKCDR